LSAAEYHGTGGSVCARVCSSGNRCVAGPRATRRSVLGTLTRVKVRPMRGVNYFAG